MSLRPGCRCVTLAFVLEGPSILWLVPRGQDFRWCRLFLVEGLPTIFYGIYLRFGLPASPETAPFLSPHERAWLSQRNLEHKVYAGVYTDRKHAYRPGL
jgi:hypothetical protein